MSLSQNEDPPWGSDGPISLPEAMPDPSAAKVSFGGLAFTPMGMVFDLSEAERQEIVSAPYGPQVNSND